VKLPKVVGLQDLGAAGLTSAAIECAERSDLGLRLDVAQVPRREEGMTPYEVMLSESQERMLLVVEAGGESEVREIFDEWDLWAIPIGEFTADGNADIYDDGALVTSTPIRMLTDPPEYPFTAPKPDWVASLQATDLSELPLPNLAPSDVLHQLLAAPNIASKRPVFQQYDHQVQTNTVVSPGGDAAVLRLRGTKKGIALSTDGNGRYGYLDPYAGGAIAVAEACRNMAVVGAEPRAATDCLNFGNPEKPDAQYQLIEAVRGIKDACNAFDIPVVSGNVSLYNESAGAAIYPTPVIGTLGVMEDASRHSTAGFKQSGDAIYLLGADTLGADPATLAGSEYMSQVHDRVAGCPSIDLELEVRVQAVCRKAVEDGVVSAAHDCSDGGIAVTLAEMASIGAVGAAVSAPVPPRWDAALFGEAQSRIIVAVQPDNVAALVRLAAERDLPVIKLGECADDRLVIGDVIDVTVAAITDAWENGLQNALQG
jgi:phosphoribosylformylglycinamidine synthase